MPYAIIIIFISIGTLALQSFTNPYLTIFRSTDIPIQAMFTGLIVAFAFSQFQKLGKNNNDIFFNHIDCLTLTSFIWMLSSIQGGLLIQSLHINDHWSLAYLLYWAQFCIPPFLYIFKAKHTQAMLFFSFPILFDFLYAKFKNPDFYQIYNLTHPIFLLLYFWILCAIISTYFIWKRNQSRKVRNLTKRIQTKKQLETPTTQTIVSHSHIPLHTTSQSLILDPGVQVQTAQKDLEQSSKIANHVRITQVPDELLEHREVYERISGLFARVMPHCNLHIFHTEDQGKTNRLMTWINRKSYHLTDDRAILRRGEGVVGTLIETDELISHGDQIRFQTETRKLEYYQDSKEIGSIMVKWIKNPQTHENLGILIMDRLPQDGLYDDDDMRLVREISEVAAQMLLSLSRAKKLVEDEIQTKALYECSKILLKKIKYNEIIQELFDQMQRAFNPERMIYIKLEPQSRKGRIARVIGQNYDWLPTKNNGICYLQNEDEEKFSKSLFNVSSHENGYYAKSMLTGSSFAFKTGKQGHCFNSDIKDDLEFGMVGYIKLNNALFATVGVERHKEFSEADLMNYRNFLMLATTAIEKAHSFAEREKQATIDVLTGIANHRFFQDTMDAHIQKSKDTGIPVSLLLMDIDFFKKFNDTYGHQIGDLVLKNVAQTLSTSIRKGVDFVARYGGEEFVVILPGQDGKQTLQSAERIRKAIESMTVESPKGPLKVTISIGSASYLMDAGQKTDLIEHADEALYHCKGRGRNCITIWREKTTSWRGGIQGDDQNSFPMAHAAGGHGNTH